MARGSCAIGYRRRQWFGVMDCRAHHDRSWRQHRGESDHARPSNTIHSTIPVGSSQMKFLIVEDDHWQASSLRETLTSRWPDAEIEIIRTESDFVSRMPSLARDTPDLIFMDVILRWH